MFFFYVLHKSGAMHAPSRHLASHVLTIDLSDVSTTLNTNSDVHSSKALLAQQQNGLQQLHTISDNIQSELHNPPTKGIWWT